MKILVIAQSAMGSFWNLLLVIFLMVVPCPTIEKAQGCLDDE